MIIFIKVNIIGSPAYFDPENQNVFHYSTYFTVLTYNWQLPQQHINLNINNHIYCQNVCLSEDKLVLCYTGHIL